MEEQITRLTDAKAAYELARYAFDTALSHDKEITETVNETFEVYKQELINTIRTLAEELGSHATA